MSQLYEPEAVSRFFDESGLAEWERLVKTPINEVKLHLHAHYLREYVTVGARVLEVGAGPGRFTQMLAALGCRIVVTDISPGQLTLTAGRRLNSGSPAPSRNGCASTSATWPRLPTVRSMPSSATAGH